MKTIVGLIALMFSLQAVAAGSSKDKMGLLLKVDFQLKNAKKSLQMKNDLILSKENNDWTPLAPSQEGVALLGKIHKPQKDVFTIEYMVVDTSTKPVTVHQMGVVSQFDKPSKVSSETEREKISVEALAQETSYQEQEKSD